MVTKTFRITGVSHINVPYHILMDSTVLGDRPCFAVFPLKSTAFSIFREFIIAVIQCRASTPNSFWIAKQFTYFSYHFINTLRGKGIPFSHQHRNLPLSNADKWLTQVGLSLSSWATISQNIR